jgi:hypothetical protein
VIDPRSFIPPHRHRRQSGNSLYGSRFAGNAYITGVSPSAAWPLTSGAFDSTFEGNPFDLFTKLNANGTGLIYSTYIGGDGWDEVDGITSIKTAMPI